MEKKNGKNKFYPPVVVVLGHVDHGKTTLLDAIRKTNIVQKEFGGITQTIGASRIEVNHEGQKRSITFIDTPGHQTFSAMRSRGARVADIGLLIVSSSESVMPQTRESIKILQEAKIPFIVVLTKADLPNKNPEKTKGELVKENVLVEGMGGNIPVIEVSAKENKNIKELLDLILLVYEMEENSEKKDETENLLGVIIESRLDQKSGPKATMVIKKGVIRVRDEIAADNIEGRVRTLIDSFGKHLTEATIGEAVEILGFTKVPNVGSLVVRKGEPIPVDETPQILVQELAQIPYAPAVSKESISIVLCADTIGSLEAVTSALGEGILIVSQKTGEITPADVLFAKSIGALVIGFNAVVKPEILNLARTEKIVVKNYNLIYELLDELHDVLEGKKESLLEEILGKAKVLASFPFEKTKVMGIVVLEGRVAKGDKVKIIRDEKIVGESTISSVRQGKNPTSKVEEGIEAGIIISPFLDFNIGDMLICLR